jgi:hypothetical protein
MALYKFGFIVAHPQLKAGLHRATMCTEAFEMVAVGISHPAEGAAAAQALAREGVQLIELCGGFGPVFTAKVVEAIGPSIPVGAVGYGPESIAAMHALFS